jgi:predicted Zn-dependent peptidase
MVYLLADTEGPLALALSADGLAPTYLVEHRQGTRGGHLSVEVITAAANETAAVEALRSSLASLAAQPPSDQAIQRARSRAAATHAHRLATPSGRAAAIEASALAGQPPSTQLEARSRLLEVNGAALQATAARLLSPDRGVLVVVGPEPPPTPQSPGD